MTDSGPNAPQGAEGVKGLRLLFSADGTFFKVARISWSASDASVYVLPYVPPGGIGYAGVMKIPGPGAPRKRRFTASSRATTRSSRSTSTGGITRR